MPLISKLTLQRVTSIHHVTRILIAALGLLLAVSLPGRAQDAFELGQDVFHGGQSVAIETPDHDDAFLSGLRVRIAQAITGNAYLLGRYVDIDAAVGSSLYAVAQRVQVAAPVMQDVMASGLLVAIEAPVSGDVRIAASEAEIGADIGDTLVVFAESVILNSVVAGDAAISAQLVSFGPEARIEGHLILYEAEPGALVVPETVISADRIDRRDFDGVALAKDAVSQPAPKPKKNKKPKKTVWPTTYLWSFAVLALLAVGLAWIMPHTMDDIREQAVRRVMGSTMTGFISISSLLGGALLLGLTVIGLAVSPVMLLALVPLTIFGLCVAFFALGGRLMAMRSAVLPDGAWSRGASVIVGCLILCGIGLIPLLGTIVLSGFAIWGAGAAIAHVVRPQLFVD